MSEANGGVHVITERDMNGKHYSNGYSSCKGKALANIVQLDTARNKVAYESCKNGTDEDTADLTEEEILLLSQAQNNDTKATLKTNLMFTIPEDIFALQKILKIIEISEAKIEHLETRRAKRALCFDVLTTLSIKRKSLLNLIKMVRHSDNVSVLLLENGRCSSKDIWFPKHISDLDLCNHILSKFEPDLDSTHPGFSDVVYRSRRKDIALIAFKFKQGQPIPYVHYTEAEVQTWGTIYRKMGSMHSKYACSAYKKMFTQLEKECVYNPDHIPQLQDVSQFLKRTSGFSLRPAAGLVSSRDFLSSLAFRVFQCTQYVRHSCSPNHSPEPDCIHELLGHVPMLADPTFAKFSQELGLASLGASDEDIEKLTKIYWFTVEFGLCKENGRIKAYGAGLLSSYGELEHALSGKPRLMPFEAEVTAVKQYQDFHYQDVYFVANGFTDAKDKIRNYVSSNFERKKEIFYDPYTETIKEVDSLQQLETLSDAIKSDFSILTSAIRNLNTS